MFIEYLVTLDCVPKQALTRNGLLALLRRGDPALREHAQHCAQCPATSHGAPFGCWGRVTFPIQHATEDWLTDQLDGDGEGFGIASLRDLVTDEIDGSPVAALRAQGPAYFERDEATECEWDIEDDNVLMINSDELLHLLWFSGPTPPSAGLILALAFGVFGDDVDPVAFARVFDNVGLRRKFLEAAPPWPPPQTPQIAEMHAFFRALVHAVWLDLPLLPLLPDGPA